MDLETLKQRLKKYPEAILDIQAEGEVSSITYREVVFTNKRYGPLWDLFKRFHGDKITDKDLQNIQIIEKEPEVASIKDDFIKAYEEFRAHISYKVKLTSHLFKDLTRDVTGVIYTVTPEFVILFDSNGAERTIAFADLIKYKFLKKID